MRELVTLRSRKISGGVESLYLDYIINGKRYRENLKMYILPGTDRVTKYQNEETWRLAMAEKAKRTMQIESRKVGVIRSRMLVTEYLREQSVEYRQKGSIATARAIKALCDKWEGYASEGMRLADISKHDILGFVKHLKDKYKLSDSTIHSYYGVIRTCLNTAVRREHLGANPCRLIEPSDIPKSHHQIREYLTLEEVRKLAATPCKSPELKQAFLFACFTGLRISDILSLEWSHVRRNELGEYTVERKMQKTGEPIYLPLSQNALAWLPEKTRCQKRVFWRLNNKATIENRLRVWVRDAGIGKYITFHCSRHTFATLALTYGADIYTVSKLLGHSDVSVTQVYAKIVDDKKRKAVDLIPQM